jgi:hypothetical protein
MNNVDDKSYYEKHKERLRENSKKHYYKNKELGIKKPFKKKDAVRPVGRPKLTEEQKIISKQREKELKKIRLERLRAENPPKPRGRPTIYFL